MSDPYAGPPGYPPTGNQPYGYFPSPRRTNGMAIASLVVSCASLFVCTLLACVGAILGHVARKQIQETGEDGDGLALAGIIVGWILFGLTLLGIGVYAVIIVWVVRSGTVE